MQAVSSAGYFSPIVNNGFSPPPPPSSSLPRLTWRISSLIEDVVRLPHSYIPTDSSDYISPLIEEVVRLPQS